MLPVVPTTDEALGTLLVGDDRAAHFRIAGAIIFLSSEDFKTQVVKASTASRCEREKPRRRGIRFATVGRP
ncbi:MAG: hypothetical protein R3C52_08840 [Hyphomonadaceae bacterium]